VHSRRTGAARWSTRATFQFARGLTWMGRPDGRSAAEKWDHGPRTAGRGRHQSGGGAVNKYGQQAKEHWQKWRPRQYEQIPDPQAFFAALGEEVQQRVRDLELDLAGSDTPGEGFMEKVGRLNMARFMAEGQALRELALPEPEDEEKAG
jgi:hypothetical protein